MEPGSPSMDRNEAVQRLISLAEEEQAILKAQVEFQALEKRLAAIRIENSTIQSTLDRPEVDILNQAAHAQDGRSSGLDQNTISQVVPGPFQPLIQPPAPSNQPQLQDYGSHDVRQQLFSADGARTAQTQAVYTAVGASAQASLVTDAQYGARQQPASAAIQDGRASGTRSYGQQHGSFGPFQAPFRPPGPPFQPQQQAQGMYQRPQQLYYADGTPAAQNQTFNASVRGVVCY